MTIEAMRLREYTADDACATLSVFLAAVTVTASSDYSAEQIAAWARPERWVLREWDAARLQGMTLVALLDDEIRGFGQLIDTGHIEMMFVHPEYTRRGVASALLGTLESAARQAGYAELTSDVSLTAREFFERHDFAVIAEQQPVFSGVRLRNFLMVKTLAA
ncbi:GNAT family N-acetyltransferase [Acaricomes phytoseiuli]|uniref:GNAT family N-acetyltransferase n=1 Tax=Acaricomes phytoseiuli TaxID=291968 RepID=UPI0003605D1E|nr:GNAT family N-acetyltransferase [Acaricomes phytoseiuli]MCW1249730.1 GNAT family N-acetyltransferase [Acaricomes phytoseiuli]